MSYLNSVESNVLNVRPVTLFNDEERRRRREIEAILIIMVMFVSLNEE